MQYSKAGFDGQSLSTSIEACVAVRARPHVKRLRGAMHAVSHGVGVACGRRAFLRSFCADVPPDPHAAAGARNSYKVMPETGAGASARPGRAFSMRLRAKSQGERRRQKQRLEGQKASRRWALPGKVRRNEIHAPLSLMIFRAAAASAGRQGNRARNLNRFFEPWELPAS